MRIFGLIGYPLSHSFSKKYFSDKFKNENINDAEYLNFSVPSIEQFPKILKSREDFIGFNITSPYKESIIPYLDELDATASEINAVNVVNVIKDGKIQRLKGYNTDVYGFKKSLQKKLNPEIKSALILGTGGAARAVFFALKSLDIKSTFVSRKEKSGNDYLQYKNLNKDVISDNLLIVNATPLGLFPNTETKPDIPYSYLTENHHLFDLIYNPPLTQFLSEGKQKHTTIQNGLEMLHFQAEKAWEIFNES